MNKYLTVLVASGFMLAASAADLFAQQSRGWYDVCLGGRRHVENSSLSKVPFYEDGDYSYAIGAEYHEDELFWQLAVDYTPSLNRAEYLITPQLNLMASDTLFGLTKFNFIEGGVGVLTTYSHTKLSGGDWSDPYFQMILGLRIPIYKKITLAAQTYYVFDNFGNITDFAAKDLEYGVWLAIPF